MADAASWLGVSLHSFMLEELLEQIAGVPECRGTTTAKVVDVQVCPVADPKV
jgi:hypothetical protein